jgi:hypothetical protein
MSPLSNGRISQVDHRVGGVAERPDKLTARVFGNPSLADLRQIQSLFRVASLYIAAGMRKK